MRHTWPASSAALVAFSEETLLFGAFKWDTLSSGIRDRLKTGCKMLLLLLNYFSGFIAILLVTEQAISYGKVSQLF